MELEEDSTPGRARRAVVLIAASVAGIFVASLIYAHGQVNPQPSAVARSSPAFFGGTIGGEGSPHAAHYGVPVCVTLKTQPSPGPELIWVGLPAKQVGPVAVTAECATWIARPDRSVMP